MHLRTHIAIGFILAALAGLTTACGEQIPDAIQTPIVIVVTGETPVAPATPTSTSDPFPTPSICRAGVVEQPFENGRMFWVGATLAERCKETHDFALGSGEIWVAVFDSNGQGGTWLVFVDDWNSEREPELDPDLVPPRDGLFQPLRGFGKVWREKLSDLQREALGWGTLAELGFVTDYQYDAGGSVNDNGVYKPGPGQHKLVSLGGELFFFDEASQTFDYVPAD